MTNYDQFASTFSRSRKNLSWPELDYILSDIHNQHYTRILDIGCGNGRFIENYEKWSMDHTIDYLGIDSSLGMIEEARKLHPGYRFEIYDMTSLSRDYEAIKNQGSEDISEIPNDWIFRDKRTWDAIIFLASFHHLETYDDRFQVLSSIRNLLAPEGRIYMTNWNLREQKRYEKSHRGNGDYDIKIGAYSRYYHGFSVEELRELFILSGYRILENRVWEGGRNMVSMIRL